MKQAVAARIWLLSILKSASLLSLPRNLQTITLINLDFVCLIPRLLASVAASLELRVSAPQTSLHLSLDIPYQQL